MVDELLDEALHELDGGALGSRVAVGDQRASGAGHGLGELVEVAEIFGDPDRSPAGDQLAVFVLLDAGEIALAGDEGPGQAHGVEPEPQVGPSHDAVQHFAALAVGREHVEGFAGGERDPLDEPGGGRQLRPTGRGLADQRARGQRVLAAGRQPGRGLALAAGRGAEADGQLPGCPGDGLGAGVEGIGSRRLLAGLAGRRGVVGRLSPEEERVVDQRAVQDDHELVLTPRTRTGRAVGNRSPRVTGGEAEAPCFRFGANSRSPPGSGTWALGSFDCPRSLPGPIAVSTSWVRRLGDSIVRASQRVAMTNSIQCRRAGGIATHS